MTDKEKIKAEIERLRETNKVSEDKEYAQYELDVKCGYNIALDDMLSFINSLHEEPVSEELEEAVDEYAPDFSNSIASKATVNAVRDAFKAGAKWQRERTIIKACEWLYLNAHTYIRVSHVGRYENVSMGIDFIDDFRKAMID